ncbi:hemolysin family protein [Aquimarina hainanensis]|uniref:Hemolysin family protein n=1 Tax=Aquimarina hainanensis TaxID=1578017 RepID=A0ABW5N8E2_9FLAO|nr:hemolysin family protein [Aquimarina sp. TRL1]QKX07563.1 HlyC/CorC family transporter [Aquimarina sp. TRL1]
MTLLLVYGLLSIFFSFLCSILEAVLLSVTSTFINVKKKEGKSYATKLEDLKKDVDKPLIAILTINTLAHTVGAILVGVEAKKAFGDEGNGVLIVSVVMTILILVLSEIIPKTIGATYWKQLSGFTATVLQIFIVVLQWTGILWILRLATKLVGKKGHHGSILSREDFSAMADIAREEGVFEDSESTVIKNLLTFKEVMTKDVMTPRTVMKIASEDTTVKEFFDKNAQLRFSRIPIYKDDSDNITGVVLKDEVFREMANNNGNIRLTDIKRPILYTHRNVPIPELFNTFIEKKNHIALVVDEYGSVSGLVTMEDVIETLLGLEIIDESDAEKDMQDLARKNWEKRAKQMGLINDKPDS